jgi:hypothetical protein
MRQKGCCRIRQLAFHFGRRQLIVENWQAYSRKSGFSEDYASETRNGAGAERAENPGVPTSLHARFIFAKKIL